VTEPALFADLARRYPVVPVSRVLPAEGRDITSVFPAVAADGTGVIWEVADEGGVDARAGRYAMCAGDPVTTLLVADGIARWTAGPPADLPEPPDRSLPSMLREIHARLTVPPSGGPAAGGPAAGGPPLGAFAVLGFDALNIAARPAGADDPADAVLEAVVVFPRSVLVLDRTLDRLTLHSVVYVNRDGAGPAAHAGAVARLDALERRLATIPPRSPAALGSPAPPAFAGPARSVAMSADPGDLAFAELVTAARDRVRAGDLAQVTVSREFGVPAGAGPLAVYRTLRAADPAPYTYLVQLPEVTVLAAAPQRLVTVKDRQVRTNALAGTRPRPPESDPAADDRLCGELLADTKERLEHEMLVGLAVRDLSAVCRPGTVRADRAGGQPGVARYSTVIHLVTDVVGELATGRVPLDALIATCPAGTVSGTPRSTAVGLIHLLEARSRGLYGGAVGLLGYGDELDACIGIRMLRIAAGTAYCRAGAGIVRDSQPLLEVGETRAKATAQLHAAASADE
jgi:anthranilate synthase component 1